MNRTVKGMGVLSAALFFLLLLILISCDSSSEDDSGTPITPASLVGTWVGTESTTEGPKALLFEFTETTFVRIIYENTAMDEGGKGTYTISGGKITYSVTENWNDTTYAWEAYSASGTMPISLSADGTTLTVPHPSGEASKTVDLKKTTFSQPASLAKLWKKSNSYTAEMNLKTDGTFAFSYSSGSENYTESGTWGASAALFRSITTKHDGADRYEENLCEYTLLTPDPEHTEANKLTLKYYDAGAEDFFHIWDADLL